MKRARVRVLNEPMHEAKRHGRWLCLVTARWTWPSQLLRPLSASLSACPCDLLTSLTETIVPEKNMVWYQQLPETDWKLLSLGCSARDLTHSLAKTSETGKHIPFNTAPAPPHKGGASVPATNYFPWCTGWRRGDYWSSPRHHAPKIEAHHSGVSPTCSFPSTWPLADSQIATISSLHRHCHIVRACRVM